MTITKYGQCCLLIEINNVRILTDPGRFSTAQNDLTDLDLILITHEHADHLHTESLETIMAKNPKVEIVTNSGVGKILTELNIPHTICEGSTAINRSNLSIEAFDGKHVEIFEEFGQVQNTGYFIGEELFYPGDAYTNPRKEVPILALPVSGPWCSSADAIKYAVEVNPQKAFPVHDYLLNEEGTELTHTIFEAALKGQGVEFVRLRNNETKEFYG